MAVLTSFRKWLSLKVYQIEVTFAVYMFTPWEKFVFWSILFLLCSLTTIASLLYLPHHIAILVSRAWYYINGDNIDVAATAREAVREIQASMLQEGTSTATAVSDMVEQATREVLKEL